MRSGPLLRTASVAILVAGLLPFRAAGAAGYTFSTGSDFAQGNFQDAQYSSSASGVVLNARTATPGYLYVSDQNSGQVFKFDTAGQLVAPYPSCVGCSTAANTWKPSAIAVDMDGAAWVVNVGSGAAKTVTRLGSTRPSIQMTNNDAPAATVDDQGTVWVAGSNQAMTINPVAWTSTGQFGLGSVTPNSVAYRDGFVYAAGGDRVFRFNGAGKDNADFACTGARSVAAAAGGKVWVTTTQGLYSATFPALNRGNPACTMVAGAGVALEGIAIDGSGKVWMAAPGKSNPAQPQAVYRYDPASATFSSIPVTGVGEPRGVAVASDGTTIWVVGRTGIAQIINGAATVQFASAAVYFDTASDMTGFQLRNSLQQGTWTVTQDAGFAGAIWGNVSWSATTPSGNSIVAQVRAADDQDGLISAGWQDVVNGATFNSGQVAGKYIQVKFTMRGREQTTPILQQVTITPSGAALGATCTADNQCGSGRCVDGVCCNMACTGQCEACGEAGSAGTCTAVTGAPRNGRQQCATDGSACGGTCNGTLRTACSYPGSDGTAVACRDASCTSGTETLAATCDGKGSCPLTTNPCNRYVCGGNACLTACQADSDCSTTNLCESGACQPDTVPPTVSVTPPPQYTNQPSLTVTGSVTDRGGTQGARLKLNDNVVVPALTIDPDTGNWSAVLTLAEGPNTIVVEATDLAGTTGSGSGSVTLDTQAPTITITSPAASQAFSTSAIDFQLTVSDATPVEVFVGGTKYIPDNGSVSGSVAVQGDVGYNTIEFVARDAAMNVKTESVRIFLDLYAPVITSDLPATTSSGPLPSDTMTMTVRFDEAGAFNWSCSNGMKNSVGRGTGATVSTSFVLAEGTNTISCTATDEVNHTATTTWTVVYDKTPPVGMFTTPAADGPYVRGGLELFARANDNLTGVRSIAFTVDSTDATTGTPATVMQDTDQSYPYYAQYSSVDTTQLPDGTHIAYAFLADGVGNRATIQQAFRVDNTAPTIELALAPTSDGNVVTNGGNQYVRGTIRITATAADNLSGVATVRVQVAGKEVASCTSSPCVTEFDTTDRSVLSGDGQFTISAVATDGAGNDSAAAQSTPVADNTAPENFIASPTTGTVMSGDTMTLRAAFGGGATQVTCSIPGVDPWVFNPDNPSVTVDILTQLDGDLTVKCTATDLVGNTANATVTPIVRHWTEVLDPVTLNLKTGGSSVVTYYVEGKNVGILLPIAARDLNLLVPGASPIPALAHPASAAVGDYNANRIPDLTLKFDRKSLITALTNAINAKAIDPTKPVTVRLYSGQHDVGQTTIRVNR